MSGICDSFTTFSLLVHRIHAQHVREPLLICLPSATECMRACSVGPSFVTLLLLLVHLLDPLQLSCLSTDLLVPQSPRYASASSPMLGIFYPILNDVFMEYC